MGQRWIPPGLLRLGQIQDSESFCISCGALLDTFQTRLPQPTYPSSLQTSKSYEQQYRIPGAFNNSLFYARHYFIFIQSP